MRCSWCSVVVLLVASALAPPGAKVEADTCQQEVNCFLPNCVCASTNNPRNIPVDQLPQFVVLTFDDAVNYINYDFYLSFKNFVNPNNCRMSMTFFVTHLYCSYDMVNELHRLGHEIALHSVTHKNDQAGYWRVANQSVWQQEMDDMRTILETFALIPRDDIKGIRAPFLEVGGNDMYGAVHDLGLQYDCSWPSMLFTSWYGSPPQGALWPYTLDYPSFQECFVGRCPTNIYPGTWVMPMLDLMDDIGQPCAMLDSCQSVTNELLTDPNAVEQFFINNFNSNYYSNKAPLGIYMHQTWFNEGSDARTVGLTRFLEWLSEKDDVYVVALDRVLAWMKNPVPLSQITSLHEFGCSDTPTNCPNPTTFKFGPESNLPVNTDALYMASCISNQPPYFPWLYNPLGDKYVPIP